MNFLEKSFSNESVKRELGKNVITIVKIQMSKIQQSLVVLCATSIPDDCFSRFGILGNFSVFWLNDI